MLTKKVDFYLFFCVILKLMFVLLHTIVENFNGLRSTIWCGNKYFFSVSFLRYILLIPCSPSPKFILLSSSRLSFHFLCPNLKNTFDIFDFRMFSFYIDFEFSILVAKEFLELRSV